MVVTFFSPKWFVHILYKIRHDFINVLVISTVIVTKLNEI